MRRLEMLSNTIFGVAMTLLAYDLPKASSFKQAPTWMGLVHVYAQPVIALAISFVVAGTVLVQSSPAACGGAGGRAWRGVPQSVFSARDHHPAGDKWPLRRYRLDGVVAVIYGLHLTLIAVVNALLWILALRGRHDPQLLATALFPVFVFVLGDGSGLRRAESRAVHLVPGVSLALCGWLAVAARASAPPSPRSP